MRKHLLIGLMATATLTACDQVTDPGSSLSQAEIAALSDALIQDGLAETSDTTSSVGIQADGVAADVYTWTFEFAITRSCLLGGEVSAVGTRERTRDTETRSGTMDFTSTRTFTDCARLITDSIVMTLNGAVTTDVHRAWTDGHWDGLQTVEVAGILDWATDDERSGTCEIDVEASFDPETRTRTVTGTVCDADAGALRRWTFGTADHGPGHHGHRD